MTTMVMALLLLALQAPPAQPPAPAPAPAPAEQPPTPPPNYRYAAEARRDPFVSLVSRGIEAQTGVDKGTRPEGIAGITVDEVAVRGIVQSRAGWVAMVASPSGKSYTIKAGDRLMNGTVRAVTPQYVVLMQDVNDPLRLEKQREVRKYLRGEVK